MAMTNAERQRAYRERALKDVDGLNLKRLQVLIESHPAACLDRLVKATGKTKKELLEQAILELAEKMECKYGD